MAATKNTTSSSKENNIPENLKIYEAHRKPPEEALKPITAGRLKGMSDINPMWRIKALTEEFGPCGIGWYYTVDKQWLEPCGNETVAFVNISLYIKKDGEWSKPINGTGGSKIIAMERNGAFVSDEAYKMATTDAISVACKQLGIAADVYWDKDITKYTEATSDIPPKASQTPVSKSQELANNSQNPASISHDIASNSQENARELQEPTAEELAAADPASIDKDLIPQAGKFVTPQQIKKLEAEMRRTGKPLAQVLSLAQVDSLEKMPHPTYCAIMVKFSHTKDAKDKKET